MWHDQKHQDWLNRRIALDVMGWRLHETAVGSLYLVVTPGDPPTERVVSLEDWRPSTNVDQAHEVMQHLTDWEWYVGQLPDGTVRARMIQQRDGQHFGGESTAPTRALAICQVALSSARLAPAAR
jgi:hypothetical protein